MELFPTHIDRQSVAVQPLKNVQTFEQGVVVVLKLLGNLTLAAAGLADWGIPGRIEQHTWHERCVYSFLASHS